MAGCQIVPTPDRFVSGMLGFFDCQAQTLGSQGYSYLASPGSSASLLLAALLTIFIALFGYRMLLGDTPTLRDGVLGFVKIGIVLAFASSWPAYRTVVYDVVLKAPAELVGEVGGSAGIPGAGGGLAARLDGADQAFRALAIYGVGFSAAGQTQTGDLVRTEPPLWAGFDTFALGGARVTYVGGAVGGFALVRLAAGLLLALGPLFFAFLLFDGTRGLFEGWARALIGTMLGALAIGIILGIELSLLEPWLADLIARRAANQPIGGTPALLLATTMMFALVELGLLLVVGRIAAGLSLPYGAALRRDGFSWRASRQASDRIEPSLLRPAHLPLEGRSRAAAVAGSIAAAQRREEQLIAVGGGPSGTRLSPLNADRLDQMIARETTGTATPRRTARRVSASAGARDLGQ